MKQKKILNNITLIGMPGSGKSTVGVLLAKSAGLSFADTDLLIQDRYGRLLQDIIDIDGIENFLDYEKEVLLSFNPERCVIATGGSAVLSNLAMQHLKSISTVAYLDTDFTVIKNRIRDIAARGIVMGKNQSLADIFMEREPLYRKYADITVNGSRPPEQVLAEILKIIS